MTRRTKLWLVWGVPAIMIGALLIAWGPREEVGTVCQFCGRGRHQEWRLYIKIHDRVTEGPMTRWVDEICPGHAEHLWAMSYCTKLTVRACLFGRRIIIRGMTADATGGGYPLLVRIWTERGRVGEEKARAWLARYHAVLTTGDSEAAGELTRRVLFKQAPLAAVLGAEADSPIRNTPGVSAP